MSIKPGQNTKKISLVRQRRQKDGSLHDSSPRFYLHSESAERFIAVLKSSQCIINTEKVCFEETGKYISPED